MEELWSNSLTAQAAGYVGAPEVHPGTWLLSLLLVVGLLLLLAWGLKRLGWRRPEAASGEEEQQVVFHCRFNARQTLLLLRTGRRIQCLVLRGKTVELASDIPGLGFLREEPPRPMTKASSFREFWLAGLSRLNRKKPS